MTDQAPAPAPGSAPENDEVNLSELAYLLDKTPSTIKRRMQDHSDFPVVARGSNGVGYRFSFRAVDAWWKAYEGEREQTDEERAEALRQMRLDLLGGRATGDQPAALTGRRRRDEYEAELAAIRLAKERGELMLKAGVEQCLAQAYGELRSTLEDLSQKVAKRLDLDRAGRNVIDQAVKEALTSAASKLGNLDTYADAA